MPCTSCGSVNQDKFIGEMDLHRPGLKNIHEPIAWVFPELVVCLDCGTAKFVVPEAELRLLAKGGATAYGPGKRLELANQTKEQTGAA
jgi:hypothetical protein